MACRSVLLGIVPRCVQLPPTANSRSTIATERPFFDRLHGGSFATGAGADDHDVVFTRKFGHGDSTMGLLEARTKLTRRASEGECSHKYGDQRP